MSDYESIDARLRTLENAFAYWGKHTPCLIPMIDQWAKWSKLLPAIAALVLVLLISLLIAAGYLGWAMSGIRSDLKSETTQRVSADTAIRSGLAGETESRQGAIEQLSEQTKALKVNLLTWAPGQPYIGAMGITAECRAGEYLVGVKFTGVPVGPSGALGAAQPICRKLNAQ